MTNHLHLIVAAKPPYKLSDIIRDFKKFTNKRIIELIEQENESRRDWMMYRFQYHAKFSNRIKDYKVWQDGYHPIECYDLKMLSQKLDYIHHNLVRAGVVSQPEYYLYSSAVNYYKGEKGVLDVMLLDVYYARAGNSIE